MLNLNTEFNFFYMVEFKINRFILLIQDFEYLNVIGQHPLLIQRLFVTNFFYIIGNFQ